MEKSRLKIALSMLSWQTGDVIADTWFSVLREREALERAGHEALAIAIDNGSTDGSAETLERSKVHHSVVMRLPSNVGNAKARNKAIDLAMREQFDMLLFLDGDIEMIPGSAVYLAQTLKAEPDTSYCVGFWSMGQSRFREKVTPEIKPDAVFERAYNRWECAWTQYGMFRVKAFQQGLRFHDAYGPGWGWEDDDLHMQMRTRAIAGDAVSLHGVTYLHRNWHSSWDALRASGVDPRDEYEKRKAVFLGRWSGIEPSHPAWHKITSCHEARFPREQEAII
ncbi:Glyco_tranf_GTA_type domain containing protein [uncultured Caudovirales phage]|uniref:Glyco_tranf_GTA_type domain containing protein n=1 Tax=uncultured Caudovirales phage TaxID=2100421 RepID=A0A6J5QSU2_9CAUD|nr:Glyco_tranf_GTA_type domain containing protein [uncultured Caudovirales phage]